MTFSSKVLQKAVEEIAQLPGIGRRTALRLALQLLKNPKSQAEELAKALYELVNDIQFCQKCHNISDSAICSICSNSYRNQHIICVVEDVRDVMAIENTQQFNGLYHVLNGKISPLEGIRPSDLTIESLVHKVQQGTVRELIFALSSTLEGDTTIFYIHKKIKEFPVKCTTIARGIGIGDELEYADELTLGSSIANRILYQEKL